MKKIQKNQIFHKIHKMHKIKTTNKIYKIYKMHKIINKTTKNNYSINHSLMMNSIRLRVRSKTIIDGKVRK